MNTGLAAERSCIFISYRRDDARGASGRVWDWLRIGFGRERVFRDVASIGAGKWRQKIEQALAASKACVAVIGRRWADATNLPRLQDPNDMVRHELETALASGDQELLTVIPLLVEDAQLAQIPADQLPESLRPLLGDWNVLALSESGWDDDTRRLIAAIAAATGLPVHPELEEWMALMAGAQQGLSMARAPEAPGAVGRQGEEQVLEGLLHRAAGADPEQRPALKAALAALANGDTLLAEASFEQEVEASRRLRLAAKQLAASEGRREADAARNVASLAVVRGDLSKAVRYFQMALEANPEDVVAALQLLLLRWMPHPHSWASGSHQCARFPVKTTKSFAGDTGSVGYLLILTEQSPRPFAPHALWSKLPASHRLHRPTTTPTTERIPDPHIQRSKG